MSCIDKTLKIYLAGKMSGLTFDEMNKWRYETIYMLKSFSDYTQYKLTIINPVDYYNFENKKHQSEKEIKEYDLNHVITSDIVIVNLDGLNTSDGTKYEISQAARNYNIPVIAFGDKKLYDELHPWYKDDITRVENNIETVANYIKDFYMI